jgi:glutamate racemase
MGSAILNALASPVIGIRDSGVGGLTVARQIKLLLPHVPLLYFADTANMPYGDRTPEEIRHFAFSITGFLQQHGANMVIFACNTTSAYALDTARNHFSIPLLGMIEDGAQAAVDALENSHSSPTIGVLATTATVRSGVYGKYIHQLSPHANCIEIACPKFVPLVESEQIHSVAALRACEEALEPLLKAKADAVILGCTHFPLLLPTLQKVAPALHFIDPAQAVAAQVACRIKSTFDKSTFTNQPPDIYFASGCTDVLRHWITSLMHPASVPNIQRAPVFRLQ